MRSGSNARLAAGTATFLAGLALAACSASAPTIANTTPPAACTVAAVMVPISATFDTADIRATATAQNGGLLCAVGIAKITVTIGPVSAPPNGPQDSPRLVLLQDHAGQWAIANDQLCTSAGRPARPIPVELGEVCGVQ